MNSCAQPALQYNELVEIAKRLSPTEAFKEALARQYKEDLAKSCRFLAMIARDHGGAETITQIKELYEENNLFVNLNRSLTTGIEFLEKIGGNKLVLVKPENPNNLSLIDYLDQSRVFAVDLELNLGEYRIFFSYKTGNGEPFDATRNMFIMRDDVKLQTLNHDGSTKEEQKSLIRHGGYPSDTEMRRRLYYQLIGCLCFKGIGVEPAVSLIIKDLEQRGHKTAPRLWKYCENTEIKLWQYCEYGLVNQFVEMTKKLREQAVAEGVKEQALAYLDLEILLSMKDVIRNDKIHDEDIPLLEKLRDNTLNLWSKYEVVPGTKAAKTYVFLYHNEILGAPDLLKQLRRLGYGGSIVITFSNLPSGRKIASTGQCHAFLQDYSEVRTSGSKATFFKDAQKSMEEAGYARGRTDIPKVPHDVVYSNISNYILRELPLV